MRDGGGCLSHTVLGIVGSSFTSGSCSSEVLVQMLEIEKDRRRYSLTPIQPFGRSHHDIVVE